MPGFIPRPFHVRFVVDQVALAQGFLRVLWFSPVSTIQPMVHTHLICMLLRVEGQRDLSTEPSKLQCSFRNLLILDINILSHCLGLNTVINIAH
jgi:hypothetical protein